MLISVVDSSSCRLVEKSVLMGAMGHVLIRIHVKLFSKVGSFCQIRRKLGIILFLLEYPDFLHSILDLTKSSLFALCRVILVVTLFSLANHG